MNQASSVVYQLESINKEVTAKVVDKLHKTSGKI